MKIIWTRGLKNNEIFPPAGAGTKISFPSNIVVPEEFLVSNPCVRVGHIKTGGK